MTAIRMIGILVSSAVAASILSGCGSAAVKAKREQRDKAIQSSKIFCDFINGENNPTDIEVALNLAMSQKCDYEQPHSISSYKTPSEIQGVLFCCGMVDKNKKDAKPELRSSEPAKSLDFNEPKSDLKPDLGTKSFDSGAKPDLKKPEVKKPGASDADL